MIKSTYKTQRLIIAVMLSIALCITAIHLPCPDICRAATVLADFTFSISDGIATAKDLNDTYNTKADSGYKATGGANASVSLLFASVAGTTSDYKKLEWSKSSDYSYNKNKLMQTPIIAASKKNPWGAAPFFIIKSSTKGYENLSISFRIGASKKGPKDYKLELSTDGSSYSTVSSSAFSLDTNKTLYDMSFALPKNADNQPAVYIKIIVTSATTIEGGSISSDKTSGEIAINNISLSGTAAVATPVPKATATPKAAATSKPASASKATPTPKASSAKNPDAAAPASDNPSGDNGSGQTVSGTKTIKTLKLTSFKKNTKTIKGKTIKKATVHVTVKGKNYTATSTKTGSFKIKLSKKLKKNNKISIYATKTGYAQSKTKTYTVK